MKKIFFILFLLMTLTACYQEQKTTKNENQQESVKEETMEITMTIEKQSFAVHLENNETVQALQEKLPMTMTMKEFNHNEKYYEMDESLPTDEQHIGEIEAGDVMLFGDNCLVIFYESFTTSYRYTRLGRVEDVDGLMNIVCQRKDIEVSLSK